ncbi:TPA: hypothetical protein ACIYQW_005007, partial [Escherichia coli]
HISCHQKRELLIAFPGKIAMMMANTLLAWMLALSRRNEGDSFDYICSIIGCRFIGKWSRHFS